MRELPATETAPLPGLSVVCGAGLPEQRRALLQASTTDWVWIVPTHLAQTRLALALTERSGGTGIAPRVHSLPQLLKLCGEETEPLPRALLELTLIDLLEESPEKCAPFLSEAQTAKRGAVSLLLHTFEEVMSRGDKIPDGDDAVSQSASTVLRRLIKRLEEGNALTRGMITHRKRQAVTAPRLREVVGQAERVVIDGFGSLDRDVMKVIGALSGVATDVRLLLDDPQHHTGMRSHLTKRFEALEPDAQWFEVKREHSAQGIEALADQLAGESDSLPEPPEALTIAMARTPHDEAVMIARHIKRWKLDHPEQSLSRVCVAFPQMDLMFALIREVLESHGIPHTLTNPSPHLAATALGQTMLTLWRLAARDFHVRDLATLARQPLLRSWLGIDGGVIEAFASEQRITSGHARWRESLQAEIALLRDATFRRESDEDEGAPPSSQRRLSQLQALDRALTELERDLRPLTEQATLLNALDAALRLITRGEVLTAFLGDSAEAPHHLKCLTALHELRDQLRANAWTSARTMPPMRLVELAEHMLNRTQIRDTPTHHEAVHVLSLDDAAAVDWDLLCIGGLTEGAIPSAPSESPLGRASEDWPRLMPDPTEELHRQRHLLWSLLRRNPKCLLLSRAASEGDAPLNPSPFLEEIAEAVGLRDVIRGGEDLKVAPWKIEDIAAPADCLSPRDLQVFTATAFAGHLNGRDSAAKAASQLNAPSLRGMARGLECIAMRHGALDTWSHWDGRMEDSGLLGFLHSRFRGHHWSATELEAIAKCGYRAVVSRMLALDERPRDEITLHPMLRGRLIHSILCDFMRQWREQSRGEGALIRPDDVPAATEMIRAIGKRTLSREPMAEMLWQIESDIILGEDGQPGLLELFVQREAESKSGCTPRHFEWGFGNEASHSEGLEGNAPLLQVEVEDRVHSVRGIIDRIDVGPNGDALCIVDYKSGGASIPPSTLFKQGLHLQLPLYALAAQSHLGKPVHAATLMRVGQRAKMHEIDLLYQSKQSIAYKPGGRRDYTPEEIREIFEEETKRRLDEIALRTQQGDLHWSIRPYAESCKGCPWSLTCRRDQARLDMPDGEEDVTEGDDQ